MFYYLNHFLFVFNCHTIVISLSTSSSIVHRSIIHRSAFPNLQREDLPLKIVVPVLLTTCTLFRSNVRKIIISGEKEFKILSKTEIFVFLKSHSILQPAKKHKFGFEFDFDLRNEISRITKTQNGISAQKNERNSWNSLSSSSSSIMELRNTLIEFRVELCTYHLSPLGCHNIIKPYILL